MEILLKKTIEMKDKVFFYQPSYEKTREHGEFSMFYCKECKKFHKFYAVDTDRLAYRYAFPLGDIRCKETGYVIKREEDTAYYEISRDYAYYNRDIVTNYIVFFDKNKKGETLLKISIFGKHFTAWNDKLQAKDVVRKFIFNLDSGMSYYLNPYFMDSKKPLNTETEKYVNITLDFRGLLFESANFDRLIDKDVYQIACYIADYKKDLLGYRPNPRADINLFELPLFNRMPSCDIQTYIKLRRLGGLDEHARKSTIHRKVAKIKHNEDLLTQARNILGVKSNKTYNNLITNTDIYTAYLITKYFKDINNVAKLTSLKFPMESEPLLKAMIEQFGEVVVANKLVNYNKSNHNSYFSYSGPERLNEYLRDMANMFDMITRRKVEFEFDKKMSLQEIHDMLTLTYNKCKTENAPLTYTEKEVQKYTFETDKYTLNYAKDTHELIEVGNKMRICVGSYGNMALLRDCDILLVKNKATDEYVCCIEKRGNTCNQIKAKMNNMVEGDLYTFIKDWLERTQLDGGYDFKNATQKMTQPKIIEPVQDIELTVNRVDAPMPIFHDIDDFIAF